MKLAARVTYWVTPSLFCLGVFWPGLWAWFQQDDFAWLGLHLSIHSFEDFWRTLFVPMAQGTIRPLSERAFFLAFHGMFGLDALPYRAWVFLTQSANLVLLAAIVSRLTASRLAGFSAAIFWAGNSALGVAMSWTSSYNQVLCAFFLLLAFYCLLRYQETGLRRHWIYQWVAFLLGFGALEMNVVYPALAAGYALCCARRLFVKTLPLFAVSGIYTAIHSAVTTKAQSGPYAMHFDASLPLTLWEYWSWAFGGVRVATLPVHPYFVSLGFASVWILSGVLLAFAVWKAVRREWLGVYLLLWFFALIGPVLPLRDHFSEYYLTMPTIGLAALGGWAFAKGVCKGWPVRVAAILLAVLYLACSLPVGRTVAAYNNQRTQLARKLVLGVDRVRQLHPGKLIVLDGVSTELFWASVADNPFRLLRVSEVYLTPGSDENIDAHPEIADISHWILPPGPTLWALDHDRAVVYSTIGERLRNITSTYHDVARSRWKPGPGWRVDAGQQAFEGQLGPGWMPIETGYRWMTGRATVILHGPQEKGRSFYLAGYCPGELLAQGPVALAVSADGRLLATFPLERPDAPFHFQAPLPDEWVGREEISFTLELSRTFLTGTDRRELGVAFGTFAIR